MPVRSCKVTIQDMSGVSHTVEVTAATLYEAVALGMAAGTFVRLVFSAVVLCLPTVLMGDTNEWRTVTGCLNELEPEFLARMLAINGRRDGRIGGFEVFVEFLERASGHEVTACLSSAVIFLTRLEWRSSPLKSVSR